MKVFLIFSALILLSSFYIRLHITEENVLVHHCLLTSAHGTHAAARVNANLIK